MVALGDDGLQPGHFTERLDGLNVIAADVDRLQQFETLQDMHTFDVVIGEVNFACVGEVGNQRIEGKYLG